MSNGKIIMRDWDIWGKKVWNDKSWSNKRAAK